MSPTLRWYVVRLYLQFIVGIGGAMLSIYLVTDFVDRAKDYQGPHWIGDAAELYAYKSLVIAHQLAPAILLLAAAGTVTTLRKRGELTAIQALAFGPRALYIPIGATALVAALFLAGFDETVVVHAVQRSEQLTAERFHRWGEWRLHFTPKRWFRHGDRIFYLREREGDADFRAVTIFTFDSNFALRERIDAARMTHVARSTWRLEQVVERQFERNGSSHVRQVAEETVALGAGKNSFNIQLGRPEQMRVKELLQQIRTRDQAGLATQTFVLALHNRFAYPLMGFPGALLAIGLALKPGRKGQLTTALVEGMGLTTALWAMMVLGKALVQAERLSPTIAAWGPSAVLGVVAIVFWATWEGYIQWRPRRRVAASA